MGKVTPRPIFPRISCILLWFWGKNCHRRESPAPTTNAATRPRITLATTVLGVLAIKALMERGQVVVDYRPIHREGFLDDLVNCGGIYA